MPDQGFRFQPPDRTRIWSELALTMSQAAQLTGVSERQIQHWMDQGYITPSKTGTRKISGTSLDQVLLIRQARRAGIPLRKSVAMVRDYLAREANEGIDRYRGLGPLQGFDDKLQSLRETIDEVQELIQRVGPEAEAKVG
jgi:DNA-binding transcriptional MerR regulator